MTELFFIADIKFNELNDLKSEEVFNYLNSLSRGVDFGDLRGHRLFNITDADPNYLGFLAGLCQNEATQDRVLDKCYRGFSDGYSVNKDDSKVTVFFRSGHDANKDFFKDLFEACDDIIKSISVSVDTEYEETVDELGSDFGFTFER